MTDKDSFDRLSVSCPYQRRAIRTETATFCFWTIPASWRSELVIDTTYASPQFNELQDDVCPYMPSLYGVQHFWCSQLLCQIDATLHEQRRETP